MVRKRSTSDSGADDRAITERERPFVVAALRERGGGSQFASFSYLELRSLTGVAEYWLADLSDDDLAKLGRRVREVLRQGKLAGEAGESGIKLYKEGLGSGLLALANPERDAGELAFELWRAKFPPWQSLMDEYGFGAPFAFIAMSNCGSLHPGSLANLVGWLSSLLIAECRYFERHAATALKSSGALPRARVKAARKKREQANARKASARTMAIDYWRAHPSASVARVISHLRAFNEFDGWSSHRTFEDAIKGCRRQALEAFTIDNAPYR